MSDSQRKPFQHHEQALTRRDFLSRAGGGFGALALSHLLVQDEAVAAGEPRSPHAPKTPHVTPTAASVIFLFMEGGPSHLDTFDPKPLIRKLHGKPMPASIKPVITAMGEFGSPILADKRKWRQHGACGTWVSDWLPHIATCVDDIAVIRSCICDGLNHVGSVCQMNTGSILAGRPSLGSWVSYGLGTENQNLPSFIVLKDNPNLPHGGPRNWGTGFMDATYQGTLLQNGDEPIANLNAPAAVGARQQRGKLDLLDDINRRHARAHAGNTELEARIQAYELAYRMQAEAPEAVDLSQESKHTQALYGLDDNATKAVGRNCLLARRLVERGVRFVQVYCGSGSKWDAHTNIEGNHTKMCRSSDKPVAGLLKDLKARGLLDSTLVVWGGEFGRTPQSEKRTGRDHNPYGFTMWMAGGGVQGGQVIGETDELGFHAIENRAHVHDIHATVLRAMGLDDRQLAYIHSGRPEKPTINKGEVVWKFFTG